MSAILKMIVDDSSAKTLAILGRQPALGLAELESLYGPEHIKPLNGAALANLDVNELNFKRLGGTIKLARLLNILPTTRWPDIEKYLIENIPPHLQYVPSGKFTLGLSLYNFSLPAETINRSLLGLKKIIRASGRSVRVVPNKAPALSSAQVLHNNLTSKGAWELLVVGDGARTYLAQSMFVQDIEAYGARDQARPKRDARIGMLPPKLAQILINLANPLKQGVILDPFCGTGVILQEGLLMGCSVLGIDVDPRMVSYAKTNIEWFQNNHPDNHAKAKIMLGDARTFQVPKTVQAIVSETYLGEPLKQPPGPQELSRIVNEVSELLESFLQNLSTQLKSGTPVSLAVPAWRVGGRLIHLPLIDHLPSLGYNRLDLMHVSHDELVYFRENQVVARQLLVLKRK